VSDSKKTLLKHKIPLFPPATTQNSHHLHLHNAIIWFWASLSRTIDRRTVDRAQNNSFWKKDKLLIMRYFQIYSFSEEIKKFIYLYLRSAGFLTLYTMIDCKSYCWANFHRILIWIHLICIDYFHQNNAIKFSSTNLISILWITKKMVAEQRSN
jgi:hypothetical protein